MATLPYMFLFSHIIFYLIKIKNNNKKCIILKWKKISLQSNTILWKYIISNNAIFSPLIWSFHFIEKICLQLTKLSFCFLQYAQSNQFLSASGICYLRERFLFTVIEISHAKVLTYFPQQSISFQHDYCRYDLIGGNLLVICFVNYLPKRCWKLNLDHHNYRNIYKSSETKVIYIFQNI